MASVAIYNSQPVNTKSITPANNGYIKFKTGRRASVINSVLPFRIRFTAVQIPGYSQNNVPPIPLQVIGFSNYIL